MSTPHATTIQVSNDPVTGYDYTVTCAACDFKEVRRSRNAANTAGSKHLTMNPQPVLTADEQAERKAQLDAERKNYEVDKVLHAIATAPQAVADAAAKFAEAGQYNINSQWSYVDAYLKAVANNEIWQTVARYAKNIEAKLYADGDTESSSTALAVYEYRKELTRNFISNRYAPNSSSQTSNAAQATFAEVASHWLSFESGSIVSAFGLEG